MAWRSSGSSNLDLVRNLSSNGLLLSEKVSKAMQAVDRAKYLSSNYKASAYLDQPLPIGWNATISAPHMHASALITLSPKLFDGAKVLDIGSGSGYLTACLGQLVRPHGKVIGIEHIPELAKISKENIKADQPDMIEQGIVEIVCSDGRQGWHKGAPYDCIHVGAWIEKVPQKLLDQLKPGGILFVPTGNPQQIYSISKSLIPNQKEKWVPMEFVRYVPLTSQRSQMNYA